MVSNSGHDIVSQAQALVSEGKKVSMIIDGLPDLQIREIKELGSFAHMTASEGTIVVRLDALIGYKAKSFPNQDWFAS